MTPHARWLDPNALTSDDEVAWLALAQNADEHANPFFEPWMLRPALEQFDREHDVRLLIAIDADGAWLGLMPLVRSDRLGRMPFMHYAVWQHSNQFLGAPLLASGRERDAWHCLLNALDEGWTLRLGLVLPYQPGDARATIALTDVCSERGRSLQTIGRHVRPGLSPGTQRLPLSRKARLASLGRRLAERSPWAVETLSHASRLEQWVDDFLELEHRGWKGLAGSSLASNSATADFFRAAVRGGFAAGRMKGRALVVDSRPIAMTTYMEHGHRAYGFKSCYDELYSAYAPGLLLLRDLTDSVGDSTVFDSCATTPATAICSMWGGQREVLDLCVALGSRRRWAWHGAMAASDLWRRVRTRDPVLA